MKCLRMTAFFLAAGIFVPHLDAAVSATGGDESLSPGYKTHEFKMTGSNTFSVTEGGYVEVLLVGGGGGGGNTIAGGGGAGGFVEGDLFYVVAGSNYTVTVGEGGLGAPTSEGYGTTTIGGRRGGDSSFAGLVAYGGGGGRNYQSNPPDPAIAVGSGGGMGAGSSLGPCIGTEGQGHAGGLKGTTINFGAGGGGAGAVGENALASAGGAGGIGRASSITGTETYYAGGGGGGSRASTSGPGGLGGLGGGGVGSNYVGNAGEANTGGGGGGGGYQGNASKAGGDGGSGIVIIRYRSADSLLVVGSPEDVGSPTPPYGITNGLASGNTFLCAAPTGWVAVAAGTRAACTGYQIFTNDVLAATGSANEYAYTHADYATLVWQWRRQYEMIFSASAGGMVSTVGGWADEGSNVTVTATATDPHRHFSYWTGDVPAGMATSPTLSFTADQPFTLTAYFGANYYVTTNGSDAADGLTWETAKRNIQPAVDLASDGDLVLVSNGVYSITSQIAVTKGVTVRSLNGADHTFIHRGSGDYRLVLLKHADAVFDGFTLSKSTRGAVYIDAAGTLVNCVVSNNFSGNNTISGGGVWLEKGGLVKNCRIINNTVKTSGGAGGSGGGLYLNAGGLVDSCVISNNAVYDGGGAGHGGGVYMAGGGRIRNCLITRNSHNLNASGVYMTGGVIESCTIVDNHCVAVLGVGGLYCSNGTILNSIIACNTHVNGIHNYVNAGTTWSYTSSCTTPAVAGTGNTALDPQFRDRAAKDYRLLPGPCVDAGANQGWMDSSANDLSGNPRIQNGTVDMGAYEYAAGALACSFEGTPQTAFMSNAVVFTAYADGTNTTGLYYQWSFDNGAGFDIEGPGRAVVTNLYWPGLYSVRLVVTNAVGEIATEVREDYVKVAPAIAYVSTNAASAQPFNTWVTAATNIQDAINAGMDGTLVLVSNGTYRITRQIELLDNIAVRSVNGAGRTEVRRLSGNTRIFYTTRPEAVIDGFTIAAGNLGGVYLDTGGVVSNCIISGNVGGLNMAFRGGGVYMNNNGLVRNCKIINNSLTYSGGNGGYGGGVYMTGGGTLDTCIISNNVASYGTGSSSRGGGVYMTGAGLIRNCLITKNSHNYRAGGVYCSGGVVENCTIVSNQVTTYVVGGETIAGIVGGLECINGTIRNTIIQFNRSVSGLYNYLNSGTSWSYNNCSTYPTNGLTGSGNIDGDPLFRNVARGNFTLTSGSPCINAGLYQSWMDEAFDLAGQSRILDKVVDIGAYEGRLPGGTLTILR